MPEAESNPWEDALIADMRAHDGAVTSGPLTGHPLLIMTATGSEERATATVHPHVYT